MSELDAEVVCAACEMLRAKHLAGVERHGQLTTSRALQLSSNVERECVDAVNYSAAIRLRDDGPIQDWEVTAAGRELHGTDLQVWRHGCKLLAIGLTVGLRKYGPWSIDDGRDLEAERRAELADAVLAEACREVMG